MSSFDNKDAVLPSIIHPILIEKHAKFLAGYNAQNNPYEFAVTEHLRMNGMYWSLTALSLMNSLHLLDQEEIVSFIKKCQHLSPTSTSALSDNINNNNSNNNNNNNKDGPSTNSETKETSEHTEHNDHNEDKANSPERKLHELHKSQYGGFGASLGHDAHLLSTLSAVQILCLYDRVHEIDTNAVVSFVSSLQQPDGSFVGDIWGEVDTRFTFCAFACLSLLGRLDAIDVEKGIDFVMSCLNFDGGFGRLPGSETHAAQVYVCLGTLSIAGVLDEKVDRDQLGWWLAERQMTKSGGLNGRPEKLPDVCYSWWVLASLCMIDRLHWIDSQKLITFILACQDDENGGIADRPNDLADPYHTLFGLAGISLLSRLFVMENSANDGTTSTTATAAALATTATIVATKLKEINPIYCMPQEVIDRVFQSQNKK